jgi:hypothetical protein
MVHAGTQEVVSLLAPLAKGGQQMNCGNMPLKVCEVQCSLLRCNSVYSGGNLPTFTPIFNALLAAAFLFLAWLPV